MKKGYLISLVLVVCALSSSHAQHSKYLKLGINYASFRNEEGSSKPGLTFGFGKTCHPIRSFKGFIGFEFNYYKKIVELKNRTWPSSFDPNDSDVVFGDIEANISFIEIPLKLGYTFFYNQKKVIRFFSGLSVSIPIKNHSGGKINDILFLNSEDKGKFEFDYVRWEDKKISASLNLQVGVSILINSIGLDVTYLHAISRTEGFVVQTISDEMDTILISLICDF